MAAQPESPGRIAVIMQDEDLGIFFSFTSNLLSKDVKGNRTYASSFSEVLKTVADMIFHHKSFAYRI